MAEAIRIQPDTDFIARIMATGGGDLKKCYQCATCSVACELSPEDSPFPRRQMIEAQWGMREQLLSDPALWLCHNCGKCSSRCPRGARPGDVLAALRCEAVREFAFPRPLGRLVANPKALPLLFLLPILLFLAIFLWAPKPPAAPFEFANLFPIPILEAVFFSVSGFALVALAVGLHRFTHHLRSTGNEMRLFPALTEIARHDRFAICEDPPRRAAHFLTFWGFLALALVGTVAGIGTMTGLMRTPFPLLSAIKIVANLGAVLAVAGVIMFLIQRWHEPSVYFDWFFLATLAGVVCTGIASELLRLAQNGIMYGVYFVHLVLVFTLLFYAPYSKFAHFAYRTAALASATRSNGGS